MSTRRGSESPQKAGSGDAGEKIVLEDSSRPAGPRPIPAAYHVYGARHPRAVRIDPPARILQPLLVRPMQGPGSRDPGVLDRGRGAALPGGAAPGDGDPPLPHPLLREHRGRGSGAGGERAPGGSSEIDKAAALLRIKTITDRTWEEVAELVKLSRDYVKRLAGLLKLEELVREKLRSGQISVRAAIALRPLLARLQVEMAERILAEGLAPSRSARKCGGARRRVHGRQRLEPPAAPPSGRPATVAGTLEGYTALVRDLDTWLESWTCRRAGSRSGSGRRWTSWRKAVSLAQQHLLSLRPRGRGLGPAGRGEAAAGRSPLLRPRAPVLHHGAQLVGIERSGGSPAWRPGVTSPPAAASVGSPHNWRGAASPALRVGGRRRAAADRIRGATASRRCTECGRTPWPRWALRGSWLTGTRWLRSAFRRSAPCRLAAETLAHTRLAPRRSAPRRSAPISRTRVRSAPRRSARRRRAVRSTAFPSRASTSSARSRRAPCSAACRMSAAVRSAPDRSSSRSAASCSPGTRQSSSLDSRGDRSRSRLAPAVPRSVLAGRHRHPHFPP